MEKLESIDLRKYNKIEGLYIILFSIAFLMRMGKYEVNYFVKYIISTVWIIIAFIHLFRNNFEINEKKIEISYYLKLFIMPYIIMSVYNVFLFLSNRADIITIGRSISYITSMFITIIAVFATVYLLRDRALTCTIYAMFLSILIVFIFNIFTNGAEALKGVIDTFVNNSGAINYFELHDITFAFGLIFLLYIIENEKIVGEDLKIFVGSVLIMIVGFKRIQLLALVIMVVYLFIIKMLKDDLKRRKFIKFTGWSLVIACIVYVWSIESGILEQVMNSLGINTMGRISFYKWICTYSDFKLSYLGIGLGTTSKMMEVYTKWPVATIHSDILRMFIEIGFIGFILWLWYYLIYSYKSICKKFSFGVGFIYFILTMYLYLLHFTDNTVSYFVTQYVYMIIIICQSYEKNRNKDINFIK